MQTQAGPRDRSRLRPSAAHADKPFKRYKPEKERAVRAPEVKPQDLRERREMLRAMDPEQALAVIEFYEDLTFFEAVELARRKGKLIVPNDVHDRILAKRIDDGYDRYLDSAYPARTGTVVIYEPPMRLFGEQVIYQDATFTVPEQFRGRAGCALVVDHPDFDLVGHELVVPDPSHIRLISTTDAVGPVPNIAATYIGSLTGDSRRFLLTNNQRLAEVVSAQLDWSHASGVALF